MKITYFNNFSENDCHSHGRYLSSSERRAWIFQPWTWLEPWHLQYQLSYEPADIRFISPTCMFITHRLTSAGSLIKWYNRTIVMRGYPPSDLISVVWFYCDEWKTKKRANAQAKPFIGRGKQTKKSKGWLAIPYGETRKNPQNMHERSKSVRLEKLFRGL